MPLSLRGDVGMTAHGKGALISDCYDGMQGVSSCASSG